MTGRVRLANLVLSSLLLTSAWLLYPASEPEPGVQAFGMPPCGIFQIKRLAANATTHIVCDDPGCEPPRPVDYKDCVPTVAWECLVGTTIECNETCSIVYPDDERLCECQPPSSGCPPGYEWYVFTCKCKLVQQACEEPCGECGNGFCEPWPVCECGGNETPILVSLEGNRLQLTDPETGVHFDLDADGSAERIAWTTEGSDDTFLALDRNGNGAIDDGTELFGDASQQQPASDPPNGFLALAWFDDPSEGGNGDGRIDASDAVFQELQFWNDANHDGFSQAGELRHASQAGVRAFDLDYRESKRVDQHGNEFKYIAKVYLQHRPGKRHPGPRQKFAVDVILRRQQ